jgi:hypothetical protein
MESKRIFEIIFANQSSDKNAKYQLIKENKYFWYFDNINQYHTCRVSKKKHNVRYFSKQSNYWFDSVHAISVNEIKK